ncbi:ribosomal protein S5 domain 2-type protein [Chytridium lagenaria]|nr:ribosomal protein S5 domain 2-type protein [Chytridium lagenaria]
MSHIDRKRIRGPEKSVIPLSDNVIPSFNPEKRSDGRSSESFRPFFAKTGMIRQANGSAYMEAGNLKVVCGVYGPRQQITGKRSSETGVLVCDFRYASFALKKRKGFMRESQEAENAMLMKQALTPAVRLHKYPKSEIDIFTIVLEGDGMASALCLAISCASLALADAGIEMLDTVAACSAGFFERPSKALQDRTLALDCTSNEEEFQIGSLVIAYMPSMREVTHMVHSGEIAISSLTEAMDLCLDGCSKIHDALRETLIESLRPKKMALLWSNKPHYLFPVNRYHPLFLSSH